MEWYMGGSRRMAEKYPDIVKINSNTDYDYNVQHSSEATTLLELIGEKQYGNPHYRDNQAVDFYLLDGGVTVITRKNLEIYKKAFEMVSIEEYIKFHWKSSPFLVEDFNKIKTRDYFNGLFNIVEKEAGAK